LTNSWSWLKSQPYCNLTKRPAGSSCMDRLNGGRMQSIIRYIIGLSIISASTVFGESAEFKKFQADYSNLDIDLLNNPCEVAAVKDFVYQKDLARFTFTDGAFYFLRYVDNRPTTAIFVGSGRAEIQIPAQVERNSLFCITHDSVVNESFENCFIRFSDDLDQLIKAKYPVEQSTLSWKIFNSAKQAQGEVFFKPVIQHRFDNYFQLLRSAYERKADGYFWVDFNRYVFAYDPNQPEQFRLAYEFEGGDFAITEAAILQKQALGVYDDMVLSEIRFPTTCLQRQGKFKMGGQDGCQIEAGLGQIKLIVNADSLKYVSLFLDFHLKEDSIYFHSQPVNYLRRRTFDFIGIILPEYHYKGDTLEFSLWYKGKGFDQALPFVENPRASMLSLELTVANGSNYYLPGQMAAQDIDGRFKLIEAIPERPFNTFRFQGYVAGADTIQALSDIGIALNFIKLGYITKHNFNCFMPENIQQPAVVAAFNFMTERFGSPPAAFEIFVSPEEGQGMPGLAYVPQVACVSEWEAYGGMDLVAGNGISNQWFGGALQPASDRESWVALALPKFLSLLYVENSRGAKAYYSNLFNRSDTLIKVIARGWDLPLATGSRLREAIASNKGVWLMHMLRFLMFDTKTRTSPSFNKFIQELSVTLNGKTFTNADFVKLAEKYYGAPLTDFFAQWLYGYNMPEFNVEYSFVQRDGSYYVDGSVVTKKVGDAFSMPVVMGVELTGRTSDETIYMRETIKAPETLFSLGPFPTQPKKFVFNEFFSVLSQDRVKKK